MIDDREQRKRKRPILKCCRGGYEKKLTFAVISTIQDLSTVINNSSKEIFTDGKFTPSLSEIFDLLKSEQNSPSPIIYLPPPLYIDTFISQNTSHIILEVTVNLMFDLVDVIGKLYTFLKIFSVHQTLLKVNLKQAFQL